MSPGFTPRPSLSDQGPDGQRDGRQGVAGVHTPAFVERWRRRLSRATSMRVSLGLSTGIPLRHHDSGSDAEACARIVLAAAAEGWRERP